jgi:hypothetical protein
MFKIPFKWVPGSWGLKGRTRDMAQAEYELTGYELERRLLELRREDLEPDDYAKKVRDLDLKHNKISQEEYHRCLVDLITDETQKELALLELDYRAGKVKELEYTKQLATLKNEPWVNVVNMDFTKKSALEGSFELDWNTHFVEKLKAEGYTGPTPDNIVNQWFMELCRNIAMEEFDGTGDFTADSAANLDAVKRWSSDAKPMAGGRKGYQ